MIPNLDEYQAAWVKELASDFGIVHANLIATTQSNARLQAELDSLKALYTATREKLDQTNVDFGILRDQTRVRVKSKVK